MAIALVGWLFTREQRAREAQGTLEQTQDDALAASYLDHQGRREDVEFYTGVLGMRLVYRSLYVGDPSIHHLALANGASSRSRQEGPTQEEVAVVRRIGRRVAEKADLLVGGWPQV